MYRTEYVAIDLETTGLDPKKDKIIEIGAAHIIDGEIKEKFETFINPGRTLPDRIVELTGITEDDLKDAPYIENVLEDLLTFIGENILLGHGVLFDYSFLKRAAVNNGYQFEKDAIDTLAISRLYLCNLPSRNLHKICEHYGIAHHEHRAFDDAVAASDIYLKLVEEYYKEDARCFMPQRMKYSVKKEGPITPPQLERLMRIIDTHKLDIDYDPKRLTKNEASRIIDVYRSQGIC